MVSISNRDVVIDRLDPVSGRWGDTVPTDLEGFITSRGAVAWTGDRLVIQGIFEDGVAFAPDTGDLSVLPLSGSVVLPAHGAR